MKSFGIGQYSNNSISFTNLKDPKVWINEENKHSIIEKTENRRFEYLKYLECNIYA